MATKETDRGQHEWRDADAERAAATRAEVVEILAGAVIELLLRRGAGPSPDEAPRPPRATNFAVCGQIRGLCDLALLPRECRHVPRGRADSAPRRPRNGTGGSQRAA